MLKRMVPCALWIVASALIIEAGSPIAKFSRPANAGPFGITLSTDPAAPNGDLWFTEFDANRVVRFSGGTFLEYPMPAGSGPQGIVMGPGGRGLANRPLWIALNTSSRIGRLLPSGAFTHTPTPTPNSGPTALTVGGDDVWFTEANVNRIARVSAGGQLPTGAIEEFPVPTPNSRPHGIVFHPPTGLWFTEYDGNRIGYLQSVGAQILEFVIPTPNSQPAHITVGPDGNLWFTEFAGNKIGRITTAGTITEFPLPTPNSGPFGIAAGPDGNLWFTAVTAHRIGVITPAGEVVAEYPLPAAAPQSLTAGPGGIWFTERDGDNVGRIRVRAESNDYDGDGKADVGVYRTSTGEWFVSRSSDGGLRHDNWGSSPLGDLTVPADYDGDGRIDPAVYRSTTGEWIIGLSTRPGQTTVTPWGAPSFNDRPVPADYDDDGRADIAVYRESTGQWFILPSFTSLPLAVPWGSPAFGDVPLRVRDR